MISAKTEAISKTIRDQIQSHMQNELNNLGIIKRFKGMEIQQTCHYIKLSCEKCIDRIIEHHGWQNKNHANKPIPMRNDSTYLATLELTDGPEDIKEQEKLERQMGFKYRQVE
jgi:ribosome-binding protein aMBF1 (putative translation factor)